ncbi:Pef1 [Acrasis kona]|uniref:Pef1 n=1 Tax=Acrasis kona TaxID=1008807 RepID=A0AAW2YLJ7_9EUKA
MYGYQPPQTYAPTGYGVPPPFAVYGQRYTMAPPNVDPNIAIWFQYVDTDRSGYIDVKELTNALSHGGWVPFSVEATSAMIRMFSSNGTGQLNLIEFQHLVTYLNTMKYNFFLVDTDRSGRLDYNEICRVLQQSGYYFDQRILPKLLSKFDRQKVGSVGLDGYIEICLFMNATKEIFQAHDYQRTGNIFMNYDQFLNASLALQFGFN